MSIINTALPIKGNALGSRESVVELAQRCAGLNPITGAAEEHARAIDRKRNGKKTPVMVLEPSLTVPMVKHEGIEPFASQRIKARDPALNESFGGRKAYQPIDVFPAARSATTNFLHHLAAQPAAAHGNVPPMPAVNNEYATPAQALTAPAPLQASPDATKNGPGAQPDNKRLLAPSLKDMTLNSHDGHIDGEHMIKSSTTARLARHDKKTAGVTTGQPFQGRPMSPGEPKSEKLAETRPPVKFINVQTANAKASVNGNTFTFTFKNSAPVQAQSIVESVQVTLGHEKALLAPNSWQTNARLMNHAPEQRGFEVVFDHEGQRQQHRGQRHDGGEERDPGMAETKVGLIVNHSRNGRPTGA